MAININTNAAFTGRITPVDANYPYASSKDETAPGVGDGSPYLKVRADDIFGFQQALLTLASIVPTGNAETALASQYLQALVELAQGRATNYDDSGAANAYVLDVQTNQQAPASLFDGQLFTFIPDNTNTGASTVNAVTLGAKAIINTSGGELVAGERVTIRYRLGADNFEIIDAYASQAEVDAGAVSDKAVSPLTLANSPQTVKAWIRFNGTGTPNDDGSFNVSSLTDFGVGDWGINFTNALDSANYGASALGAAVGGSNRISTAINSVPTASQLRITTTDETTGNLVDTATITMLAAGG